MRILYLLGLLLVFPGFIQAQTLTYQLLPKQIAMNTWVITGLTEDFSSANGGDVVNSAFIVTDDGVLVLDTGPSKRYGEALRQLISEVTTQPILAVYNSHHHPDHFLGNQAFADLPIYSLPSTAALISSRGEAYTENMYRLLGDWMRGTDVQLPSHSIELGEHWIGGHQIEFLAFSGHSGDQADLVILDKTTGVLFAFDLVFNGRALTTPDTPGLERWIEDLEQLRHVSFEHLVPGHGVVTTDATPIDQTQSYLRWLDALLSESARQGLSAIDVMIHPIPDEFTEITLTRSELQRSVVHLYADYEARFLVE